jgi:hypothetical protein
MVMMIMMVLTVTVTGALWFALQTQTGSRRDQDFHAAIAAAQAGVDDFLARVNQSDTYWATVDCANTALQRPMGGTCSWGAGTQIGWRQVPGSNDSYFHYDVDASTTYTSGTVKLTVTGKAGDVKRTVVSNIRKTGFGEFLYYTDFETVDPSTEVYYGVNNTAAQTYCARHYWDNPARGVKPGPDYDCHDINFVGGDILNGPVHSNDAMLMMKYGGQQPRFVGEVTTAYPACRNPAGGSNPPASCYRANTSNGTVSPIFEKGIAYTDYLPFPASIGSLKPQTDPTVTGNPGCLYTGPTRIKFLNNGTMKVWSRWSKQLNAGCGNPAGGWPQTVNVPNNNLIYVQDVPATSSNPNYWPTSGSGSLPSAPCATGAIDRDNNGGGTDSDSFQIPVANDDNNTLAEANCRYGTVYVQGELSGRVTIAADNNVIITDHLTYKTGANGTDVLGLIASNSVKVYHPVDGNTNLNRGNGSKFVDPKIYAAMLSVKHGFTVQSFHRGSGLGDLKVFGTIAQLYRGAVGTTSGTGYLKDYEWDSRLKYAPPPFFLDPVGASWGQKTFGEIKAVY